MWLGPWALERRRGAGVSPVPDDLQPVHASKSLVKGVHDAQVAPPPIPVATFRRDGADTSLVQQLIDEEAERVRTQHAAWGSKVAAEHMRTFAEAAWRTHERLGHLFVREQRAYNKRAITNPDHWYEINTANPVLFDNLALSGMDEVLPGRLFTTRMPRNVKTDPASAEAFKARVQRYKLNTVLILTETEEYQKYAGTDLEAFYRSLGLEIIHRPIQDFSLPIQADMIDNINDLTMRLAEGRNCLVHCAGGSGRTGMVVAGVFKNVGISDPISWVRRVKTTYVETREQEDFVNAMPPVLDARIAARHPNLVLAIATEFIIDHAIKATHNQAHCEVCGQGCLRANEQQIAGLQAVFNLVDTDSTGTITVKEMDALFKRLGATVEDGALQQLFGHEDMLTREKFFGMFKMHLDPEWWGDHDVNLPTWVKVSTTAGGSHAPLEGVASPPLPVNAAVPTSHQEGSVVEEAV